MGKRPKYFEIVREKKFEDNFKSITKGYPRASDIEENIDWALSRNPYFFPKMDGKEYHIWKTGSVGNNFPQLLIIYKIDLDQERVLLLDVFDVD